MNISETTTRRAVLAAVLTAGVTMSMEAQASRDTTGSSGWRGPRVTRGIGYYDTTLRRVVIVGGTGQASVRNRDRVWSWSGTRWELVTDSGPAARGNGGAAYDPRRLMGIVTGGAQRKADDSTFAIISDTWEGTPTGWRRIMGTDVAPRDHQTLVYDEARSALLMFGGIAADRATWPIDTWELRPDGWTRLATDGPAGRARTALAYDGKRRQVVLFGGVGAPPGPGQPQPFFDDTWSWEGAAWRKVADGGPRARYAHGMVFDERAGVVLLYGGAAAHRDAPLADMWQWDGRRWTEIGLTGPTPGHRYQPIMVYDRARGKTVLYGGLQGSEDETWEWDGHRWREIRP